MQNLRIYDSSNKKSQAGNLKTRYYETQNAYFQDSK